jgi:hypothetical protein
MPEGTHRRNTARYLYQYLPIIGTTFDILVATENDMIEYKDDIGFIYYYALKEGKIVYDRKIQAEVL